MFYHVSKSPELLNSESGESIYFSLHLIYVQTANETRIPIEIRLIGLYFKLTGRMSQADELRLEGISFYSADMISIPENFDDVRANILDQIFGVIKDEMRKN